MHAFRPINVSFVPKISSTRPINQITPLNIHQRNSLYTKPWIPNGYQQNSYPFNISPDMTDSPLNNTLNIENQKPIKTTCSKALFSLFAIIFTMISLTALGISIYLLIWINTSTTTTITTTSTISTNTTSIGCTNSHIILTFDDLTHGNPIPNGYNNMNWNNTYTYTTSTNNSGYYTALITRNFSSYSAHGNPTKMTSANGCLFTLNYAAVAAAWYDNLQLTVIGYNSSTVIRNQTYTLQVFTLSVLIFTGYSELDSVQFITSGGIQNAGVNGSGTHFAMDNLCLTFI